MRHHDSHILSVAMDSPIPKIDYRVVDLKDILIEMTPRSSNQKAHVDRMEIKGVGEVEFSERFMISFLAIFGISRSTFNLFSPDEVIDRLLGLGKGDKVRLCIEQRQGSHLPRVLGALNVNKPYVESFDLWELYKKLDIPDSGLSYHDGVVRSEHKPSMFGDSEFQIGDDDVVRRFVMDVPIDGWSKPSAYLQITRLVCSNGMIGEAPAFRSAVELGDNRVVTKGGNIVNDAIPTLKKFIESHNNEEGFQIMTSRLKTAAETPASLEEFYKAYKLLTTDSMKTAHRHRSGDKGFSDLELVLQSMVGDTFMKENGLVSLDQISYKKRSLVPIDCSVKDIVDLVSEISTHRADPNQAKRLSSFIGQTLSDDAGFDLEGDTIRRDRSKDLYLTDSKDAHEDDDDKEIG